MHRRHMPLHHLWVSRHRQRCGWSDWHCFQEEERGIYYPMMECVSWHHITPDVLRSHPLFFSPVSYTGCCACRRTCWTALWPGSGCAWRGWSVSLCQAMETEPWWRLQYRRLSSRGQRLVRNTCSHHHCNLVENELKHKKEFYPNRAETTNLLLQMIIIKPVQCQKLS